MIDFVLYALLSCIDFNTMDTHIHIQVEGIPVPNTTGVTPEWGGTDTCMREMHTHYDKYVHLEGTSPITFTLRPFLDFIGISPMGFSNVTINNQTADFDTPLKNFDKIRIN